MSDSYGKRMAPEPLLKDLSKKRYTHYVTLTVGNQNFVIQIKNGSKADLTSDDIKSFISSLPDGTIYPVNQIVYNDSTAIALTLIQGIKNDSGTNKIVRFSLGKAISDSNLVTYKNLIYTVTGDYEIVSQYVL